MKSWFAKWCLSQSLDAGTPLPRWLRRRVERTAALRAFDTRVRAVDAALKEALPRPQVPAGLHAAIMSRLQAAQAAPRPSRFRSMWRWLPVPTLAAAAVLGVWLLSVPAVKPPAAVLAVDSSLEASQQLLLALPGTGVAPLSEEWQRLNQDWEHTEDFLLASLPGSLPD